MDTDYTKHKHQITRIIHSPKANYVMNVCNCTQVCRKLTHAAAHALHILGLENTHWVFSAFENSSFRAHRYPKCCYAIHLAACESDQMGPAVPN